VVALVEATDDPYAESDLGVFSSQFGLPPCTTANGCFTKATPEGQPGIDPQGYWQAEISLDIQWVHAIAPSAKILLVEAKTQNLSDIVAAIDYASAQPGVHQVSMSWGFQELSNDSTLDSHFQVSGVSFFASSGDCGWYNVDCVANGAHISWPAVSQYVIGIGGSNLSVDAQGNVLSEVAWSYSSGGPSAYFAEPSYQVGFQSYGVRGVPDASYNAGAGVPIYDTPGGGWNSVGGTSAGTPQWAALMAIVNSKRSIPLSSGYGGAVSTLYAAAEGSSYSLDYRDIIKGNNANGHGNLCGAKCKATVGYDLVTGLGSPLANSLVPFLAGLPSSVTSYSVTFSESGLPSGTPWSVVIDGTMAHSGTSSQIVVSGLTQFDITYAVPAVGCKSGCQYAPSPSSGSLQPATQRSVGIVFTKQYYLTVSEVNTGLGACGALFPTSGWYQAGSTVPLTAKWTAGCTWQGWVGTGSGSYTGKGTVIGYTATASVTMSGAIGETGTFTCKSYCQL
jgi:hypothetical protein